MRRLLAPILVLALTACGIAEGKELAERAVDEFHARYDEERFADIWDESGSGVRDSVTGAEFVAFMEAVRRKLGRVRRAQEVAFDVNVSGEGTRITLAYTTEFDRGVGTETFVFYISDGRAVLHGYEVNSRDLVLR